jgi:hypothetical protein
VFQHEGSLPHPNPTQDQEQWPSIPHPCFAIGRCRSFASDAMVVAGKFGLDEPVPDLRHLIAQCHRHSQAGQACGVYYADLKMTSVALD